MEKEIAEGIPIVPTSYRDIPIPGAGKKDWFSAFWSECFKRIRFLSLPAFLRVQKEKAPLMVQATLTLKEYFITKGFKEDLQKQIKAGSEQEVKVLLKLSSELERDPTYFVRALAQALDVDPSALVLKNIEAAV